MFPGALEMKVAVSHLIGYAWAIVVGHVVVSRVVGKMWDWLPINKQDRNRLRPKELTWHAGVVGMLERALYVTALVMGQGSFIGIWLALKVAGQWKGWTATGNEDKDGGGPSGRAVYNIFLIGTALSLLYAVVGYGLIVWGWPWPGNFYLGLRVMGALGVGTWVLYLWMLNQWPR